MAYKINRRGHSRRKKKYPIFMVLLTLALCVGVSLGLALLWQTADTKTPPRSESEASTLQSSKSSAAAPSSEFSENTNSQQSTSLASSAPEVFDYTTFVPESERVTTEYFNDAMFVGDSITAGISSYALMKESTVVAFTGINPDTILTREVIRNSDGQLETILKAMSRHPDVKKIYIMLGANGIAWIGKESFVNNYFKFLSEVRAQHPEAIIYIQSILPVTDAKQKSDPDITNQKIGEYNEALFARAQQEKYFYLDVAEAFRDQNGCLPDEASPTDGMHFGPSYYEKWFEYLKNHVAPDTTN